MAKFAISLVVILVLVGMTNATVKKTPCEGTSDPKYCKEMFGHIDLNTEPNKWERAVLDTVTKKVTEAKNEVVLVDAKTRHAELHQNCLHQLTAAIKKLDEGIIDTAAANVGSCADSYNSDPDVEKSLKSKVDDAYKTAKVGAEFLKKGAPK